MKRRKVTRTVRKTTSTSIRQTFGIYVICNVNFPSQEPVQLINNVKELLALQTDAHNRQPFQAQESLHKFSNDQLAKKTSCNTLSLEDEDYDHLNYTRTVNELSPNYIKLNNDN